MGKKIFISYKYGDDNVFSLRSSLLSEYMNPTTVRDYVDQMQALFEYEDHVNKGEPDGEDLSDFKDSTIESSLRDKIYDSSITIVVISPKMKESQTVESDQWIPWEISYSLKEHTRNERTSLSNAILAVVLPDKSNSYSYYIEDRTCCSTGCRVLKTNTLFEIINKNMFNIKQPTFKDCQQNSKIYTGDSSYILSVKWCDFKTDLNKYINTVVNINENISQYDIIKTVD